jgi:hypothetical protein
MRGAHTAMEDAGRHKVCGVHVTCKVHKICGHAIEEVCRDAWYTALLASYLRSSMMGGKPSGKARRMASIPLGSVYSRVQYTLVQHLLTIA